MNGGKAHLDPTQASGRNFVLRGTEGEVVMCNLLRIREVADCSATPELRPAEPVTGWDLVLMVPHRSVETFIAFARREACLSGMGHRIAPLEDSRLLPLVPLP